MNKHTPGPWTGGVLIGIAGQDEAGISIGFVNSNDAARREECKANARLIAAAPALLSILEDVYVKFGDYRADWPGRHNATGQSLLGRMRDTIATATGRTDQDVQDDYGTRLARTERGE